MLVSGEMAGPGESTGPNISGRSSLGPSLSTQSLAGLSHLSKTRFENEVMSLSQSVSKHPMDCRIKNYLFYNTILKKLRSIAFQPCVTLGGVHWLEWVKEIIFSEKLSSKQLFFLDMNPDCPIGGHLKILPDGKNRPFLQIT